MERITKYDRERLRTVRSVPKRYRGLCLCHQRPRTPRVRWSPSDSGRAWTLVAPPWRGRSSRVRATIGFGTCVILSSHILHCTRRTSRKLSASSKVLCAEKNTRTRRQTKHLLLQLFHREQFFNNSQVIGGGCRATASGLAGTPYTSLGAGTCVDNKGNKISSPNYSWIGKTPGSTSECRAKCDADVECRAYIQSGTQSGVGGTGNCMKFKKQPVKTKNFSDGWEKSICYEKDLRFHAASPHQNNWRCHGSATNQTAVAICFPKTAKTSTEHPEKFVLNDVDVVKGGKSTKANCSSSSSEKVILVGGGCSAAGAPHKIQKAGPASISQGEVAEYEFGHTGPG